MILDRKIRWGILATGSIAGSLAEAIHSVPDAELVAVASRTTENAQAFANRWNVPRRYGSYEGLAADPDVDVIYIATPHNLHYENMIACLSAGKHVLCEKAFTLNAREARECIELARRMRLFLMEAMWMRFFPAMARVREWVAERIIGQIRLVQADFCFIREYDPAHRLYDPHLGGGALLDLGIYPLSFTTQFFGFPEQIDGHADIGPTGVDELDTIRLIYPNGLTASLSCSMRIIKPREAFLIGTEGYIKVHDIFHRPDRLTLNRLGIGPRTVQLPFRGNGYAHEIEEVHACLRAGMTESTIMPLDETLQLMEIMDGLRHSWGVSYPNERR